MWAILAIVVGVTVVADERFGTDGGRADDQVVAVPDGTPAPTPGETSASTPPSTVAPLADGQVRVEGHVTALHVEGAVLDPRHLATPLTLVSDRGFGNGGELTGIAVDGQPSSIVWDGGRPFVLSSGAGVSLGPVTVDLVPDGLRLLLGSSPHALDPGPYRLDTPVAVGSSGMATPHDGVSFDAGPDAQLEAHGDSALVLTADAPRRFVGPGRLHLEGELTLVDADGRHAVTTFTSAVGPFELTLAPAAGGGWTVTVVAAAAPS